MQLVYVNLLIMSDITTDRIDPFESSLVNVKIYESRVFEHHVVTSAYHLLQILVLKMIFVGFWFFICIISFLSFFAMREMITIILIGSWIFFLYQTRSERTLITRFWNMHDVIILLQNDWDHHEFLRHEDEVRERTFIRIDLVQRIRAT